MEMPQHCAGKRSGGNFKRRPPSKFDSPAPSDGTPGHGATATADKRRLRPSRRKNVCRGARVLPVSPLREGAKNVFNLVTKDAALSEDKIHVLACEKQPQLNAKQILSLAKMRHVGKRAGYQPDRKRHFVVVKNRTPSSATWHWNHQKIYKIPMCSKLRGP